MTNEFEIGPIRPPSEAESLLLRVTRNCSWNKCKFCTLYKKHSFSARTVDEIKADIDQVALYRSNIIEGVMEDLDALPEETAQRYLYIMRWIAGGEESVFLQDANTVVLTYDKLRDILVYLREKLPRVKRVTTYGRVDSLNKFTVEQLTGLREAGLDRIHSGYESGSDKVLSLINKGYTKAQEIEAGQKVKASGIELSVYYMPGSGGKGLSDDNALETADVVNKVNPDFVRIRTFVAQKGTELHEDIAEGRLIECTDREKMLELKKMIEHIDGADGSLYSDHIINLFEDVNGNMKTDKEKMLSVFNAFESLPEPEQRGYQIARRMGMVRSLAQFGRLNSSQKESVNAYLSQLDTEETFETFLSRLLRRYI
jgi:radical SAM superfamily enzyme YgiQ (UPF0313 family)